MKKVLILMLAVGLAIGIMAMAGCGSDSTTVKTPEGDVTVTEEGGEFTIEGEDGDVTWQQSSEVPSEEELGAPIYPGAEYVEGSTGSSSGSSEEGAFAVVGASFSTNDSFEEVVSFYESELGAPLYEGVGGEEEAVWIKTKGQTSTTVSVISEDGEVVIQIGTSSATMNP